METVWPRHRLAALPQCLWRWGERFAAAGERIWLCGGAVRDLLLGRPGFELDLATTAAPERAAALLDPGVLDARQPWVRLGGLTGVVCGRRFELTTLRRERDYADHRRPSAVEFVREPACDARRRDFTANALYLDLQSVSLVDPLGGIEDLRARRLRVVGDPCRRFAEDPLRVLRGLRFAAQLGFVPDAACWDGIVQRAPLVAQCPAAKLREELDRLLVGPGRARGLHLLVRSGAAAVLLPEVAALEGVPQPPDFHPEGEVLRHTLLVLAHLREPVARELAWAALLHDIGKPATFERAPDRIRFHGHDRLSAELAERRLEALGYPKRFIGGVCALIAGHIRIAGFPRFRPARREAFLRDPLFSWHLELHRADCLASHGDLRILGELRRAYRSLAPLPPPPLVTGRDLLELGFAPGPELGRVLAAVASARAEGRIATRAEALAMARRLRGGRSSGEGDRR